MVPCVSGAGFQAPPRAQGPTTHGRHNMGEFSRVGSGYNKLLLTVEGGRELVTMLTQMLDAYESHGKNLEIPEGAVRKSYGGVDNLDILMFEDDRIDVLIATFADMALEDHRDMEARIEA